MKLTAKSFTHGVEWNRSSDEKTEESPESDGKYIVWHHWSCREKGQVFQLWNLISQIVDDPRRLVTNALPVQGGPELMVTMQN
jgi:hypothetical protein